MNNELPSAGEILTLLYSLQDVVRSTAKREETLNQGRRLNQSRRKGDADEAVPLPENGAILKQRYDELGGVCEVIIKPGGKHHPHSLADPKPIVDFIKKRARF